MRNEPGFYTKLRCRDMKFFQKISFQVRSIIDDKTNTQMWIGRVTNQQLLSSRIKNLIEIFNAKANEGKYQKKRFQLQERKTICMLQVPRDFETI